ncbi:MAG: pantoate--beta-alanine ligase [Chloroflexi bacterium]|nr:MAG: pantoate--beta-alanine ligase [Chloroflexota bacterium]
MEIIRTVQALEQAHAQWKGHIGLVPTMGYLHEGHLSLFRQARTENDFVVGSIFVNPTQFGPHEDLERYPRDLARDLHMLEELGTDVVFVPSVAEMYPRGFTTYVAPEGPLVEAAEGATRPGLFRGVATIVLKLFQLVRPQRAYFGQKDAQQAVVINRIVTDLNVPVQLHILPIIRESDGLAMSSRNSYLDRAMRNAASVLYRALQAGKTRFQLHSSFATGFTGVQQVVQAMEETVAQEPMAQLIYAQVRDASSFLPLETLHTPALLLIAACVGNTRLIDNFFVRADGTWDEGVMVGKIDESRNKGEDPWTTK